MHTTKFTPLFSPLDHHHWKFHRGHHPHHRNEADNFSLVFFATSTSTASTGLAPGKFRWAHPWSPPPSLAQPKDNNRRVRISKSKQKIQISEYLFMLGVNSSQHIIIAEATPPFLQHYPRSPPYIMFSM
jgi:hypothetical protein